jgi:hypothetical protein
MDWLREPSLNLGSRLLSLSFRLWRNTVLRKRGVSFCALLLAYPTTSVVGLRRFQKMLRI